MLLQNAKTVYQSSSTFTQSLIPENKCPAMANKPTIYAQHCDSLVRFFWFAFLHRLWYTMCLRRRHCRQRFYRKTGRESKLFSINSVISPMVVYLKWKQAQKLFFFFLLLWQRERVCVCRALTIVWFAVKSDNNLLDSPGLSGKNEQRKHWDTRNEQRDFVHARPKVMKTNS